MYIVVEFAAAVVVLESVFKYFLRLCKSFFQVKVCQMLLRLEKKVLFSFQFRKNVSFCQKIGVCLARGHLSSGRRNDDVVVRCQLFGSLENAKIERVALSRNQLDVK